MPEVHDRAPIPSTETGDASARPAWVTQSDEHARLMLALMRRFEPESLAALGDATAASDVTRLSPGGPEERLDAYEQTIRELGKRREGEAQTEVRLDLEAMITLLGWQADLLRAEAECLLPYVSVTRIVFESFLSLLTAGTPADPAPAARRRLRRYAGLEAGYVPLARQAQDLLRASLSRGDLVGPWRQAVLEDLENGPRLLAGIGELFEERRIDGTASAFAELRRQLDEHHDFLRRELLPRCRQDFPLPPEVYAARLAHHGIDLPAAELGRRAEAAFEERRCRLEELASRVARDRDWPREPFPDVLRRLERDRLTTGSLLDHYRRRCQQLEQLIETSGFVSPPSQRPRIRLASAAESALLPFPHFRWPPAFDPSCGAGELVLPARAKDPGGEFATSASSWVMVAHEVVPGHALQISRLLEPDISLARGSLGFHLAALEGWAVYAGSELAPELPLEARFLTLHRDLRRAAVAFLDPALHQGRLSVEQASRFLQTRVGLNEGSARQTVWRITTWSPGQAASYFFGHSQLAALRTAVECRLGAAFDRRRFHDRLLAHGLLPLTLLRRRLLEPFAPQDRRAA